MASKWMQKVKEKMQAKGTVGSFSKAAKNAGESTEEYAEKESSSPNASTKMKKKANLAKVFAKFRK